MAWRESDHPRHPSGTPGGRGGEFRAASGGWVGAVAAAIRSPEQDLLDLVSGSEPTKRSRLTGGQTAQVRLLTYPGDGEPKRVVHKKMEWEDDAESMAASEVVVARIGAALGARVPVTVLDPDDPGAVYMDHLLGDPAWVAQGYGVDTDALHNTEQGRRLGLLDLLVSNQDRHGGNWLVGAHGEVAGIDHSLADLGAGTRRWDADSPFVESYLQFDHTTGMYALLPIEDMDRAEAEQIGARLRALFDDPEFVHMMVRAGGTETGLMSRWDAIARMVQEVQ